MNIRPKPNLASNPVRVDAGPQATERGHTMTRIRARSAEPLNWALFLLFAASSASAQSAQEIAKKAFGATVLLVMDDANGQPLSLGSGFFVRNGEIASNLHVVEGSARGYAKLVGEKTKFDIEGITAVDPERDLVVVRSQRLALRCSRSATASASKLASLFTPSEIRKDWKARSRKGL